MELSFEPLPRGYLYTEAQWREAFDQSTDSKAVGAALNRHPGRVRTVRKELGYRPQKRKPPAPPEKVPDAIFEALSAQGVSYEVFERETGLNRSTIRYRLNDLGLPLPTPPKRKVDRDEFKRVVEQDGVTSLTRLAKKFNVDKSTIRRVRKELKMPTQTPTPPVSAEKRAAIAAMLDDGAPFVEIHDTLGVSLTWLRKHHPGRGWTAQQASEYREALLQVRRAGIDL